MQALLRKLGLFFALGIVALTLSVPSFAGSQGYTGTIDAGGIDFTATLIVNNTTDTYTLDFTGQNTNLTTATMNAFALQLFGGGSNASFNLTGDSIPANWMTEAGAKINNSGGLGCNSNGNGVSGWLCGSALTMSNVLSIAPGQKFDMTFAGTFGNGTSVISMFDLMANGLTNSNDSHSKWSISQGFDWTEFTPIPEPSSLAMLGSGLLAFGGLLRKRLFL